MKSGDHFEMVNTFQVVYTQEQLQQQMPMIGQVNAMKRKANPRVSTAMHEYPNKMMPTQFISFQVVIIYRITERLSKSYGFHLFDFSFSILLHINSQPVRHSLSHLLLQ